MPTYNLSPQQHEALTTFTRVVVLSSVPALREMQRFAIDKGNDYNVSSLQRITWKRIAKMLAQEVKP